MEQGNNTNSFLNHHCRVRLLSDFCLFGIITEITPTYFILQTPEKTTILSFVNIKEISLDPRYYGGR